MASGVGGEASEVEDSGNVAKFPRVGGWQVAGTELVVTYGRSTRVLGAVEKVVVERRKLPSCENRC